MKVTDMGQYFNPNHAAFAKAVRSQIYVDKTGEKFVMIIDEWDAVDAVFREDACNHKVQDGYSFRRLKHVYCPNSVANAMLDGEYNSYWTGTIAYESLKYYIAIHQDGLQSVVIRLLAGDRCKVNAGTFENDLTRIHSKDDVLTILIHLGYLAYDAEKEEVYIPNEEVRRAFMGAVAGTDWAKNSAVASVDCLTTFAAAPITSHESSAIRNYSIPPHPHSPQQHYRYCEKYQNFRL